MNPTTTTIAAPATPQGTSAIAVVRMSGPDALATLNRLVRTPSDWQHRTSYLRTLYAPDDQPLDQTMVTIARAPTSYTGEDIVEIQTHGNPVIVAALLQTLQHYGVQPADAGAFTRRAILNGKMGLPEAEALAELIDAVSPVGAAQALSRLRGALRDWAEALRADLIGLLAQLEAHIDFPDEPISPDSAARLAATANALAARIWRQADAAAHARLWTRGAKITIIGAPNAGKSTLLNRLLGQERAIVSPWAGTTRDYLEAGTTLGGMPIRLIDTAGMRDTDDPIERVGVERSLAQSRDADLVLAVSAPDAPLPPTEIDAPHLSVWNKSDLETAPADCIAVSATEGDGIDTMVDAICDRLRQNTAEQPLVSSLRQEAACREAGLSISHAAEKLSTGFPPEIAAEDVRAASAALDRLLGRIDPEQVLDELFSHFCIGK